MVSSRVDEYLHNCLGIRDRIRLAVFAVIGWRACLFGAFKEKFNNGFVAWADIQSRALCMVEDPDDVRIPYAMLRNVAKSYSCATTEAEKAFILALQDLEELVDAKLFDADPWRSSELFGACFYALTFNAWMVLERSEIYAKELLSGALMDESTGAIKVKLQPSRVFLCEESFGADTSRHISRLDRPEEKVDWISNGCIAVSKDTGAGSDIFFSLPNAFADTEVVFVDQRRSGFGQFGPSQTVVYLDKLAHCPTFLKANGARLVRGIISCVSNSTLSSASVPCDCFVMSSRESGLFYGTLESHPACSVLYPADSITNCALKSQFQCGSANIDHVVNAMDGKKRKELSG